MKPKARLGILDWGIGGVGVWRAIRRRAPRVPVLYFSDSGHTPYGLLSKDALAARVTKVVHWLEQQGATGVVVACNAASTALADLESAGAFTVPVTGMIAPLARSFASSARGTLGVLGGRRTIRSQAVRRALEHTGLRLVQRIAQPLSAHIERGSTESAACARDLKRILAPLRNVDSILLACTHYPAIQGLIAEHAPGVRLIDPADCVAEHALATFRMPRGPVGDCALTTGNPRAMSAAAERAWSFDVGRCARCRID